jgi:hypothetical protein
LFSFHPPDRHLEVAHLKAGNRPDVRPVERHHHWATFGPTHPMRAASVEGLKALRGPGQTASNPGMIGCFARRQQQVHHPGGLPEREAGTEFSLNTNEFRGCSRSDYRRCAAFSPDLFGLSAPSAPIARTGSPARLSESDVAKQCGHLPLPIVVQRPLGPATAAVPLGRAHQSDLFLREMRLQFAKKIFCFGKPKAEVIRTGRG